MKSPNTQNVSKSKSFVYKFFFVIILVSLIASLVGNIVLGYAGYKYFQLRQAYSSLNTSYQNLKKTGSNDMNNDVDNAINPFMFKSSAPTLTVSGSTVSIAPSGFPTKKVEVKLDAGYVIQNV